LASEDVSARHAEINARLRNEYFATVELAKRLALSKQIFPMAGGK